MPTTKTTKPKTLRPAKPAVVKAAEPKPVPLNIHPADELSDIRAEQKRLEKRADELRDQLLADGADLKGDFYTAVLVPGVRETLDRKAITEAFGEAAVKPFIKSTSFVTVKLAGK